MASEKVSSFSLVITKNGQVFNLSPTALTEDLSGNQAIANVQAVGTSWEAINIGDLASVDLLAVRNADSTNYVELATANDGTGVFAKLTAGRGCFLPCAPAGTYYAKANTAACELQYVAVEP